MREPDLGSLIGRKEFVMSTLIIGGAFVVALLALIGLVFIIRSEPGETTLPPATSAKAVPATAPVTAAPVAAVQDTTQRTTQVTQKLSPHLEEELPTFHKEEELSVSNGQVQE